MKLRKTMVVLLLLVFAIGMLALAGCKGDEPIKRTDFEIVLFDADGNEVKTHEPYKFAYDGEEHVFSAKVKLRGEYILDAKVEIGYDMFIDGQQIDCSEAKNPGTYAVYYYYRYHEGVYFGVDRSITIIIE